MFLRVGDIRTTIIGTDTTVGVTRVHQHNIGVLYYQLSDDTVHGKRLTCSRRANQDKVGIIGMLHLTLLTCKVDAYRQSLAVSQIYQQRRVLCFLDILLEAEAQGSITQCQEEVIVWVETIGIARKRALEQFQLVVCSLRRRDTTAIEFRLDERGDGGCLFQWTTDNDIETGVH